MYAVSDYVICYHHFEFQMFTNFKRFVKQLIWVILLITITKVNYLQSLFSYHRESRRENKTEEESQWMQKRTDWT